jgi:TonB family protein
MAITSNPNVSEGYFLRGYANLETGEIERAIQDLDQAVRANPDDVMTHSLRGRAHFALDQYDAALADFETASRLAPDHPETELENDVRAMMAQTPAPVAAKDADPNGAMPSRAVGHTHNCSAYYPYLSNAIGEAGDVLVSYDVGADGAIADVAIRKTSGFERLDRAAVICVSKHWRNLPATLKGVGVASANHEAIIRYIAYVSDTASSIKHRGLTLAGIGDFNGAIVQFDQWIAAQPGSSDAYFNRGLAELALQRNDDAQRDFGDAAKLDPKNDNAIAGRDMARAATLKPLPRNGGI